MLDPNILLINLLSPPVLFFVLGLIAATMRSDLAIPDQIAKLFSLYLLWAIGFKGGVALSSAGLSWGVMAQLLAAIALSALGARLAIAVLRRRFTLADACAIGAAYGSVSVVTFVTAANFLEREGIRYGGHMVAALALMEAPAILVAVMTYRGAVRSRERAENAPAPAPDSPAARDAAHAGPMELFRETILSAPIFLLLGSLLAGALTGERGYTPLRPFSNDIFQGVLVFFLLDAGLHAGSRLGELRRAGPTAVAVGVLFPLVGAGVALALGYGLGMSRGNTFLFMVLGASASYIAVPATMRVAIPAASPALYLPMALGVTFPFNITLGIPLYLTLATLARGEPTP